MDRYVSIYYTNDRYASAVWVYYGNGELIISDELISDDNITHIASQVKYKETNKPYSKVIGNDVCFGKSSRDDIRGQFKPMGVSMKPNKKYDELGALELLNELVTQRRLKVHKNCVHAIEQLNEWRMDVPKYDLEHDFGLCYAILNVISLLKDKIKPRQSKATPYRPYSKEKETRNNTRYINYGCTL